MDELHRYRRPITKDEINQLPLVRYQGPVRVINSTADLDRALPGLLAEPVLGFDTEIRPSFKKGLSYPVSLLQLATAEEVILFQLGRLGLPRRLADLMADKNRIKAGVAVRDDIIGLQGLTDFTPGGFADLADIASALDIPTRGLRNMAANLLGKRISKGAQVSNWARDHLSDKQITYAATDAWISRELYLRFLNLGWNGRG